MGKKRNGPNRATKRFGVNDTFRSCQLLTESFDNGGVYSGELRRAFSENNFSRVVSIGFNHAAYGPGEVDRFQLDYMFYNLLRKFPTLPGTSANLRGEALKAMFSAESRCKETNSLVHHKARNPGTFSDFNMILFHARRKIYEVVGDFCWDSVIGLCDFGPGASTRLKRTESDVYYKLQGNLHLTSQAVPLFRAFQEFMPGMFDNCEIVSGNKIVTVPKDAKTDRPIAIEPCFNMFIQKGIGSALRNKLKSKSKEKIDLNDQSLNQQLAKYASLGFGLATIDLSSASDTLSTSVVELLMPEDWHNALCLVRSTHGLLDGELIRYHKFSSMGNGYTFELESLIFWALAKACIETFGNGSEYVSVYGDDIVISSSLYDKFRWTLDQFGFIPNEKKSFASGSFFESCGKHYFEGRDVTPVYVDKVPRRLSERVSLCNELILLSSRIGTNYRDSRVLPCLNHLISTLPKWLQKPRVPVSHKGNAIIGDFDEVLPKRAGSQKCAWIIEGIVTVTKTVPVARYESGTRKSLYTLLKKEAVYQRLREHQFQHKEPFSADDSTLCPGSERAGFPLLDQLLGRCIARTSYPPKDGVPGTSQVALRELDAPFVGRYTRIHGVVEADRTLSAYELVEYSSTKSKKNILVSGLEWSYLGPWI